MPEVVLIVAMGRNRVIGDGRSMPWHLPADLAFFKRTTMGHPLVMGRATYDSIGRALPGRRTIVVTRQSDWTRPDVEVAHGLAEALALAGPSGPVFVAGGGQIYAQAMSVADTLVVTEVDAEPIGSTIFPAIDPSVWRETSRTPGEGLAWVTYHRRDDATAGAGDSSTTG